MELKTAIETITSIKHVCRGLFPPKEQEALSLGIEALKFKIECNKGLFFQQDPLLPGETPD